MNKPDAIVVDTNILIDFLEPDKYSEETFYTFLMRLNSFTHLIIPQQILTEWDNLKKLKIGQYESDINSDFDKYKNLISYVSEQQDKVQLELQILNIRKLALRAYRYTYAIRARLIDNVISTGTIIERTPNIDKMVVDYAIEQKAPFFFKEVRESKSSNKNESMDAVIFFSIIEFFKKNRDEYNKVTFITSNSKDFSEPNNDALLHHNLKEFFDELEIGFFNHMKPAIKYLQYEDDAEENSFNNLVKTVVSSNKNRHLFLTDHNFIKCRNCPEEVHKNSDSILKGEYYYLVCPSCGHTWNTGDNILDNIY